MNARPPATQTQHAIDGLRRAIVDGELRPAQRVGQEEIADALGVSLAPVRERYPSSNRRTRHLPVLHGYFRD